MQKCAFACVCMCDSLLSLRKMKRSVWPGAQREDGVEREGEKEGDWQEVEREREMHKQFGWRLVYERYKGGEREFVQVLQYIHTTPTSLENPHFSFLFWFSVHTEPTLWAAEWTNLNMMAVWFYSGHGLQNWFLKNDHTSLIWGFIFQ